MARLGKPQKALNEDPLAKPAPVQSCTRDGVHTFGSDICTAEHAHRRETITVMGDLDGTLLNAFGRR